MTIRTRFTLMAIGLLLPSVFAVSFYIYTKRDTWKLERPFAGSERVRQWTERALSGKADPGDELFEDVISIAVRRDDWTVVFSDAPGLAKGESLGAGQFLERAVAADPGADYIAESVPGNPSGSYVAVLKPQDEAWYQRRSIVLPGLVVLLECLIMLAGIVLMLRTSSSILGLGEAARRISAGDLDFTLKEGGKDEVALLYRAFDDMRKKLAEAQEARSRFLMGVSHDLRTPLTSIKGYLQALEEGLALHPAMQGKFLAILKTKTELLESRIQELIEFASLETATWRANMVDLGLREFLEEIGRAAAGDAEVSDRKFAMDIRIDPASTAKADPRLFLHVLENLLSNAFRYTRPGDTVTLQADEDDRRVRIIVGDDGPGISEEDRKHIFDEFYRGSRARNQEGMGLGLSIAKSVVSAHGWEISLSENSDRGTAFLIAIPKT